MVIREIWDSLENEAKLGGGGADKMVVRQLEVSGGRAQFLGINSKTMELIHFVQLGKGEKYSIASVPRIRSLNIQCDDSEGLFQMPGPWVILSASEKEKKDVFYALSSDLSKQVNQQAGSNRILDVVANVLAKWKSFFERGQLPVLSYEEQRGLFGELIMLDSFLAPSTSLKMGTKSWYGGLRKAQDFIFEHLSIEVKTLFPSEKKLIRIPSLAQLQRLDGKSLFLVVISLNSSRSVGSTLPQYLNEVKNKLLASGDIQAIDHFKENVEGYGYSDGYEDHYVSRFSYRGWTCYEVKDAFPRLNIETVPQGIEKVNYQINLLACDDYQVNDESVVSLIVENQNE